MSKATTEKAIQIQESIEVIKLLVKGIDASVQELLVSNPYDTPRHNTRTNINNRIVVVRDELLQLKKMVEQGGFN